MKIKKKEKVTRVSNKQILILRADFIENVACLNRDYEKLKTLNIILFSFGFILERFQWPRDWKLQDYEICYYIIIYGHWSYGGHVII